MMTMMLIAKMTIVLKMIVIIVKDIDQDDDGHKLLKIMTETKMMKIMMMITSPPSLSWPQLTEDFAL